MTTKEGDVFCVDAIRSPKLVARFYELGLCASPDGMTIKEAQDVTQTQLDSVKWNTFINPGLAFEKREYFNGFRYFTQITKAPKDGHLGRLREVICPNTLIEFKGQEWGGYFYEDVLVPPLFTKFGYVSFQNGLSVVFTSSTVPSPFTSSTNSGLSSKRGVYVKDEILQDCIDAIQDTADNNNGSKLREKLKPISEYNGTLLPYLSEYL
jgi:hypothetical protein